MTRKGKKRGPGRPAKTDSSVTRERILNAARLLFAAGGYEATSLRQIAGAADVDLATVKYHYDDKKNLYAEVYKLGHNRFMASLGPMIMELALNTQPDELRARIHELLATAVEFVREERDFIRMMLFRVLEEPEELTAAEGELQSTLMTMVELMLEKLRLQGLVRRIDLRSFMSMMFISIPMWGVAAEVRPDLLGSPTPTEDEWLDRVHAFLCDVFDRVLLTDVGLENSRDLDELDDY